jgi:hypothetical protein
MYAVALGMGKAHNQLPLPPGQTNGSPADAFQRDARYAGQHDGVARFASHQLELMTTMIDNTGPTGCQLRNAEERAEWT